MKECIQPIFRHTHLILRPSLQLPQLLKLQHFWLSFQLHPGWKTQKNIQRRSGKKLMGIWPTSCGISQSKFWGYNRNREKYNLLGYHRDIMGDIVGQHPSNKIGPCHSFGVGGAWLSKLWFGTPGWYDIFPNSAEIFVQPKCQWIVKLQSQKLF